MSDKEIFNKSGPVHLTTVDWANPCDRQSVAACLVQAAYVMKFDQKNNRLRSQALAPPWWEFFHFKLRHKLIVDVDVEPAIFGAVFTLSPRLGDERAPGCVVAFRGTTSREDVKLDKDIAANKLQERPRFKKALEAVRAAVEEFGAQNVWMAGHSLGAAIALLAGKAMAEEGVLLENAFLFNSPFVSLPLGMIIKSRKVCSAIRRVGNAVMGGIMGGDEEAPSEALSKWRPRLFVNELDVLCSEYISHFQGWERMHRVASQRTLSSLVTGRKATHLIPSAHLTVNRGTGLTMAHNISQWWDPKLLHLETKTYIFPNQS